ncbi:MAG: transglutaminase family protein [Chthoniobacteraceae bacterium]
MTEQAQLPKVLLDLTVRVGCKMQYHAPAETHALLAMKPRQDMHQLIVEERLNFDRPVQAADFEDDHGNHVLRFALEPGYTNIVFDAIVQVPSEPENFVHLDAPLRAEEIPASLLRYTLPSRYCDSDKLRDFAWQNFGQFRHGLDRIHAICDWLHHHIEYRTGSGSPELSAHDVIQRRYGVCRDLAHCGVALCRTFNLPARYVSGFVSDIGCVDPGTPMDFHAYFEVFMGGRWQTFDARFNAPRIGRVRISSGYDAATCAFSTFYGAAHLTWFEVWSYQIDPGEVHVGEPVDLSQRLCGDPEVRRPGARGERPALQVVA